MNFPFSVQATPETTLRWQYPPHPSFITSLKLGNFQLDWRRLSLVELVSVSSVFCQVRRERIINNVYALLFCNVPVHSTCSDDSDGKYVGLRVPLPAAVMKAARTLPPRTNRRRMTKKRGGAKILAILRRVRMRSSISYFVLSTALRGVQDGASVSLFLLSLTQAWNFLNAPLGSTFAFTASICPHPRPLRACAEPQAGISPPRRSPLCLYTKMVK